MLSILFEQATTVFMSLLFILVAILLSIVYRDVPGVKLYTAGTIASQIGNILFFWPSASLWPTIVIANILFILSIAARLKGLADLTKAQIRVKYYFVLTAILVIAFLIAALIYPSRTARVIIINGGLLIFYLGIVNILFNPKNTMFRISQAFFIPAFLIILPFLSARFLNAILPIEFPLIDEINNLFVDTRLLTSFLMLAGFFILAAEYQMKRLQRISAILENKVNLQNKLISFLSHEFKTPINAVLIKLELMRDQQKDNYLTTKFHKDLDFIQQINQQLLAATASMLANNINTAVDKEQSNESNSKLTVVKSWLNRTVAVHKALAENKGLKFNITVASDVPKNLIINTSALQLILINLLSNSTKYTSAGHIHISVTLNTDTAEASTDPLVRFTISDSGMGIPKEDIATIQYPYKRAGNSNNTEGTGLGLAIVQELLKGMQSTLEINSEEGVGTTASFLLPAVAVG